MDQQSKATYLRAAHHLPEPLVLANAWDAASAKIFEAAGFSAIATTSAGIAFSNGYPDGEHIPLARMLEVVARICSAAAVPVTADMEAGYGATPEAVGRTTAETIEAGAVGLNLQDGIGDPGGPLVELSLQLEKLKAVREAGRHAGVDIVLNARTDSYLRAQSASDQFRDTVERAAAYRDAGADCIFVPGVADAKTVAALLQELHCPLNLLVTAASPPLAELKRLGIARVTFGSGPMRAAMRLLQGLAREALQGGTWSTLQGMVSHAEMNNLMSAGRHRKG